LDGTNNAGERAIGWWVKERYRSMGGYEWPASVRHSSRLIAAMDNAQDGRGFALAEVIASRAGEGGRPAPSSPQPSSEQSSREPADLAVTAPPQWRVSGLGPVQAHENDRALSAIVLIRE